jgi:hypothetical protein
MGKALSFLLSEQNIFGGENTTVPLSQVKAGPFSKQNIWTCSHTPSFRQRRSPSDFIFLIQWRILLLFFATFKARKGMISYRETNGHSIQVQMEKEKGWECTQEKEKG